jgi:hypothetical protein
MVLDLFKKPHDLKGGIIRVLEDKNQERTFCSRKS